MQVHAVADSERVMDSTGRRLPWGYDFGDSDHPQRRMPEEKGPFGKARKRGSVRKTTTPAQAKEEQAKIDNLRVVDDIFSRSKLQEDTRRVADTKRLSLAGSLPVSASAPNLLEGVGATNSFQAGASTNNGIKEPTEVILYGYGNEVQWAAIDYFEKVSGGIVYEEYDRQPPSARYNLTLSQHKAASYKLLSKPSVRKINEYVGGEHWIKVTFDSPEAAERACHYSPHVIQGFRVYAERYRGTGQNPDQAILASASPAVSLTASPNTMSSGTLLPGLSSNTASSATATGSMPPRSVSQPALRGAFPLDDDEPTLVPTEQQKAPVSQATGAQKIGGKSTLRLRTAKEARILPAESALLPTKPRWQQKFGSWPVIGWIIGSNHGIIGDQVPRKEDGTFDSAGASLYWRTWYAVDSCFGTDFCGVKEAEYDD